MKIETVFCDLHPTSPLIRTTIKYVNNLLDVNEIPAEHCSRSMCDRHYTEEWGYFPHSGAKRLDLGDVAAKRRCGENHEVRCLKVTRIDGKLVWACPEPNCPRAEAYEPPA